jgi:2-oxoglutarate ferredoxin oxidoreductase subunit beta
MEELRLLRTEHLPHIWCAGCGHGIVLGAVVRAMLRVGVDPDRTVVVSGIGCSSRAVGYLNMDTLHTTHGRALAFATGIKLARPDLRVVVLAGDGDLAAIGGNHLIHAARRNMGITCVCFNNGIYGMTSGQYSPLTPAGYRTATAPYGHLERDFDLCRLVQAAGATYVARSTTYHVHQTIEYVARALGHEGFAFVEVVSQCPTYFGRRNRMADPVRMLEWFRERAVTVVQAGRMKPEELQGRILIGELHRAEGVPEYTRSYRELVARLSGEGDGHER